MKDILLYWFIIISLISWIISLISQWIDFLFIKNEYKLSMVSKIIIILIEIVFILFSPLNYILFYFFISTWYILENFWFSLLISPLLLIWWSIIFWLMIFIWVVLPVIWIMLPFLNNKVSFLKIILSLVISFLVIPLSSFIFSLSVPYIFKPVNLLDYNKILNVLNMKPIQKYYKYFIFPLKKKEAKIWYSAEEYMVQEQFPVLVWKKNIEKYLKENSNNNK